MADRPAETRFTFGSHRVIPRTAASRTCESLPLAATEPAAAASGPLSPPLFGGAPLQPSPSAPSLLPPRKPSAPAELSGPLSFDERSELQALREQITMLRGLIEEYQRGAAAAHKETELLRRERDEARADADAARRSLDDQQRELSRLRTARDSGARQLRDIVAPLQSESAANARRVRELEAERALLHEQTALLRQRLAHVSASRRYADQELAILRAVAARRSGSGDAADPSDAAFEQQMAEARRCAAEEDHSASGVARLITETAAQLERLADSASSSASADQPQQQQQQQQQKPPAQQQQLAETIAKWSERYQDLRAHSMDPFAGDYCFTQPDLEANLQWECSGVVRLATPEKLVELLTSPSQEPDSDFVMQFLVGYRGFWSNKELLKKLVLRYNISDSQGNEEVRSAVRTRVVGLVYQWMHAFPGDFESKEMHELALMFICAVVVNNTETIWLLKELNRSHAASEEALPSPVDWHTLDSIDMLRLSPVDIARQMTLLDTEILTKITVDELSCPKNWTSPSKSKTPAKNVLAMVERFNAISNWVQTEILHKEDVRGRCKVMQHFVRIFRELLALNNHHAALGVASAFNTPAILRLHITNEYLQRRVLNKKEKATFAEMAALTDSSSNWRKLRSSMEAAAPPGVPHLGTLLSDLLFLDEGNPDAVEGLVNFAKKRLQAKLILRFHAFVVRPHVFSTVVQIRAWLQGVEVLSSDDLFDLSKQVEPSAASPAPAPAPTPTVLHST